MLKLGSFCIFLILYSLDFKKETKRKHRVSREEKFDFFPADNPFVRNDKTTGHICSRSQFGKYDSARGRADTISRIDETREDLSPPAGKSDGG